MLLCITGPSEAAVLANLSTANVIMTSVLAGVLGAAFLLTFWMIRERTRSDALNEELRNRVSDLSAALQRNESLLNLKDQRLIVWPRQGEGRAELVGDLPAACGAPHDRSAFMAFGRWLTGRTAAELESAIIALRDQGEPFDTIVASRNGTLIEVIGRLTPHHSIVRFLSVSAMRAEHVALKAEHEEIRKDLHLLQELAEAAPLPMWIRETDGTLSYINPAYAGLTGFDRDQSAGDPPVELLDTAAREMLNRRHGEEARIRQETSMVIAGDKRRLDITSVQTAEGRAGMVIDRTETAGLRDELERMAQSHALTLDRLNTAIAIFDRDEKLRFYNQAFQSLFGLDTPFLESVPSNTLLLDRLRQERILSEQPEWRRWKDNVLSAYRAIESQEHWWHLPDGRTIRVIANPQPNGGVTWIFENLTEQMALQSRYTQALRVQGETLENLAEGVVVFGPDGKIRLANPAFASLWSLPDDLINEGVHISAVRAAAAAQHGETPWADLLALVTGFDESRATLQGTTELSDGTILAWTAAPLPAGQFMVTFVDQTDSLRVARALKDKNEALQRADQLKNDFVQHVSYELRSPLTNIIGFTDLIATGMAGPLTPTQDEYIEHISTSSATLLTIVNDILDLATVDAGMMQLEIEEVDVANLLEQSEIAIRPRLEEDALTLVLSNENAPDQINADPERMRQVLHNLLSNAADHAPEGSTISLTCRQASGAVEFSVHDDGPGVDPAVLANIFKRFQTGSRAGQKHGAGLGLAIVKSLVELHEGEVTVETGPDEGTTVTCRIPFSANGMTHAAE
ncbi:PAS domain-containing protein [Notoacmeibacter ruber]|uniref:histidine kinase n=2 Tax=Notoacmeibacter ruber TaxID=2670375 RepID=A0A3L7JFT8_9HYPH|nr:PAS domain-containing protein [Notoacmeibacter ruber]